MVSAAARVTRPLLACAGTKTYDRAVKPNLLHPTSGLRWCGAQPRPALARTLAACCRTLCCRLGPGPCARLVRARVLTDAWTACACAGRRSITGRRTSCHCRTARQRRTSRSAARAGQTAEGSRSAGPRGTARLPRRKTGHMARPAAQPVAGARLGHRATPLRRRVAPCCAARPVLRRNGETVAITPPGCAITRAITPPRAVIARYYASYYSYYWEIETAAFSNS
jgi:hypothetical protein